MAIDFGNDALTLSRVDQAMESGDLKRAMGLVSQLLHEASSGIDSLVLRGVATYRLAAINFYSGDFNNAHEDFEDAARLLVRASQLASDDETAQEVANAITAGERFYNRVVLEIRESSIYDGSFARMAICIHGCRIAVPPCGFSEKHCK